MIPYVAFVQRQPVSCVDGVAYVDERVFAVLDRDVRDWFSYDSGQRWPVMVVIDVERQSTE